MILRRLAASARRFEANDSGAALAEFAVVFTFICLPLLLGTFEFGRGTWVKSMITAAAREGTRYAIVHGSKSGATADNAAVASYVQGRTGLSPIVVTTTWSPDKNPGSVVQVQVTYAYVPVVSVIAPVLAGKKISIPLLSARPLSSTSSQVIAY
jgi:Flp pilus assembly protein TadG